MPSKIKKVSLASVDELSTGDTLWDNELKGFGVRCQAKAKSYILKTRINGRQRFLTIGRHGQPWTPKSARIEALRLLGEIAGGKDPVQEKKSRKMMLTVGELADRFLTEHADKKLKPGTAYHYRSLLTNHVIPALGRHRIEEVSTERVSKLHNSLSSTPYQANRALAVISKMYSWAERNGYVEIGSNPTIHVERYEEKARDRFLSDDELARLGAAIGELETESQISPFALAAIRLLTFTGCRKGEILSLRWQDVDMERGLLYLPDSKTGRKTVYLNGAAIEVLEGLPRVDGKPYVIVGGVEGKHFDNLSLVWRRVRERAELEPVTLPDGRRQHVRLHDLRHTFASIAASGGASLPMIGKLLGHSQAQTTARYAHLADDPVARVGEAAGAAISEAMRGSK
ncbi:site-specific integrase [Aliiroseovarius sp. S1123]|uniref:site-specific integrase n=1 Tax=Aliiroseovarius sp. S1123 TaxID=2926404 RepID=UPI001FF62A93|nr:site-specific integrase [Aliiroseovarius sp. S1123]MCK0172344.1 site-specific integrase [Aliiroseovarius sp. S1123]